MARVPNIQREQLTSEHQPHYDAIASTRGYVGPNFAVLFNSPEATGRFAAFGEYVRYHGAVPPRLKELAIITAARAANNAYVWTAHERLAREHGVTDVIIDAIRNRTAPDGLTGDDAKVVRFTSELLTTHEIADDTFDAMHQMWLLLDSRVVDLSRWSPPTFATLSSLSPLFFNGIRNVLRCSKSVKAADPGLQ